MPGVTEYEENIMKAGHMLILVLALIAIVVAVVKFEDKTVEEQKEYEKMGISILLNEDVNKLEVTNTSGIPGMILIEKDEKSSNYIVINRETIPLHFGDGEYTVKMYLKSGKKNRYIGKDIVNAVNTQENSIYLGSQYYGDYSNCVEELVTISKRLWEHTDLTSEFVLNCYKYVCDYEYDTDRQLEIEKNKLKIYKPDLESIISNQSGICLDKASLMAAILRLNEVPTKVIFGNVDGVYHAWVEVYLDNEWRYFDPTFKTNYSDLNYEKYEIEGIN